MNEKEKLENGIAEITDYLKNSMNDTERALVVADRADLRERIAALPKVTTHHRSNAKPDSKINVGCTNNLSCVFCLEVRDGSLVKLKIRGGKLDLFISEGDTVEFCGHNYLATDIMDNKRWGEIMPESHDLNDEHSQSITSEEMLKRQHFRELSLKFGVSLSSSSHSLTNSTRD